MPGRAYILILMMKARAPGPLRAGDYGGLGGPVGGKMVTKQINVGEKIDFSSVGGKIYSRRLAENRDYF